MSGDVRWWQSDPSGELCEFVSLSACQLSALSRLHSTEQRTSMRSKVVQHLQLVDHSMEQLLSAVWRRNTDEKRILSKLLDWSAIRAVNVHAVHDITSAKHTTSVQSTTVLAYSRPHSRAAANQ